ncbi:hypothetical protein M514_08602, partial [Trichuris suis]
LFSRIAKVHVQWLFGNLAVKALLYSELSSLLSIPFSAQIDKFTRHYGVIRALPVYQLTESYRDARMEAYCLVEDNPRQSPLRMGKSPANKLILPSADHVRVLKQQFRGTPGASGIMFCAIVNAATLRHFLESPPTGSKRPRRSFPFDDAFRRGNDTSESSFATEERTTCPRVWADMRPFIRVLCSGLNALISFTRHLRLLHLTPQNN